MVDVLVSVIVFFKLTTVLVTLNVRLTRNMIELIH